jgi:hypothetical protein
VSRFLTRTLAAVRAEVVPIARPAPAPKTPEPGFGGFGGFGGLGGFGERAENENTLAPADVIWPAGVDWCLTHDAVKLAGILNMGGTARWCPSGGLDMWREDGRYVGFGPRPIAAMREAGLLPKELI